MDVIVEIHATVDKPGKSSIPFIINVIQSDWYCLNDKESLEFFSLYLKQNDVN